MGGISKAAVVAIAAGLCGTVFSLSAQAVPFLDRDILVEDNAIAANPDSLARFKDMGDLGTISFYNDQLDTSTGRRLFPGPNVSQGDPNIPPIATEPVLRTGSGEEFENFFSNPALFGSAPVDVPFSFTVNHEIAMVYQFDVNVDHWSEVELHVGADNGIFLWLDGNYIFGALAPGSSNPDEYTLSLPDLDGGAHVLQVLAEDHGVAGNFSVQLRGVANPVPEPGALGLLGVGLLGLGLVRRRRKAA